MVARASAATGFRIRIRFLLDKKNAEGVLLHIRTLFGFGFVSLRKTTDIRDRYTNSSFTGLTIVSDYFIAFPLTRKKSASFVKWNEIPRLCVDKKHLTPEGVNVIRAISKQVNAVNNET